MNVLPHPPPHLLGPHPHLLRSHRIVDFSFREVVVEMAMHVDSLTMPAYYHGRRYSKQSHVHTFYRALAAMVTTAISVTIKLQSGRLVTTRRRLERIAARTSFVGYASRNPETMAYYHAVIMHSAIPVSWNGERRGQLM